MGRRRTFFEGIQAPDFLTVPANGKLAPLIGVVDAVYTENGTPTAYPGTIAAGSTRLWGMKVTAADKQAAQWNAQLYQGDQGTAVMWLETTWGGSESANRTMFLLRPISADADTHVFVSKAGTDLDVLTKNGAPNHLLIALDDVNWPANTPMMLTVHWKTNFVKIVLNGGTLIGVDTSATLGDSGPLVSPFVRIGSNAGDVFFNDAIFGMFAIWKKIQANTADPTDHTWEQNVFNRTHAIFGRDEGTSSVNLVLNWQLTGADINPIYPGGLTPTVTRASTKIQQMTAATAESFANNVLKPTEAFDDNSIAGTPIESAYSNDLLAAANLLGVAWDTITGAVAGGETDPLGNSLAFKLTPAGGAASQTRQDTGIDCQLKACVGTIWIRSDTGSHTARFRVHNGSETSDLDVVVTTTWQRVVNTVADSVFTSVGNCFFAIFPDISGGNAAIHVYMPAVVVDTTLWATPAFETRADDAVVLDVSPANVPGMRWDRGSILFDVWNLFEVGHGDHMEFIRLQSGAVGMRVYHETSILVFRLSFGGNQSLVLSTAGGNFNRATSHKIGLTYGPDTINIFLNGIKAATAPTTQFGPGALESGTKLHLGQNFAGNVPNSIMSNLKWYNGVQSDAFMIAATT